MPVWHAVTCNAAVTHRIDEIGGTLHHEQRDEDKVEDGGESPTS